MEQPQFETTGAIIDVSRNGVLQQEGMHELLRKMAVMGLNVLMIYMEDTYEVDDYPYFGYMRGSYSEQELKLNDDYAHKLGIEMIPCIQTLGHLSEALKWNYAEDIRDTNDIVLVGEEKTYTFLEAMIRSASKPFRTNRIHLGMDEAFQLGLGNYLKKYGYQERFNIMNEHLRRVVDISEQEGLSPMIWSDMYFRLGSKEGSYYDPDSIVPESVKQSIPNTQLVYWDYYHTDEAFYRTFIRKHQALVKNPIFAGGAWTWNGISPNYGKARATTEAALKSCKTEGIKEVFITMWGDNGTETPMLTALPMLQLFAEHAYQQGEIVEKRLEERFEFSTGVSWRDAMLLNKLDETPGVSKNNLHESNPSKFLLWQDVLIGLYDKNIEGLSLNNHYTALAAALHTAKENNPNWLALFDFYKELAALLGEKAEIGIEIKRYYDENNRSSMRAPLEKLECLQQKTDSLRKKHRALWFSLYKPFGWESLEVRYGGLSARLETAAYRITQWVTGELERIEELEEDRLEFEGPYVMPEGSIGRNLYHRIITAGYS
ncbi:beta-N-acetylhexosaminidase [Thalassobacillus sp. CUG 92003]|uniref:beta-N-acetylhexosaminidase n=1 Tax=Thalassobacillus sp. CUG 92003 TaxID=2736641 RepID=UPI00351A5C84